MKIRTTIAVMAAKITGHVCKLMGRQGVTWACLLYTSITAAIYMRSAPTRRSISEKSLPMRSRTTPRRLAVWALPVSYTHLGMIQQVQHLVKVED